METVMRPDPIERLSRKSAAMDRALDKMRDSAERLAQQALERGVARYDRERHLPELIRVTPEELADRSLAGTEAIIARLQTAIQAGQKGLRKGHWAASGNRVMALRQALEAERRALALIFARAA